MAPNPVRSRADLLFLLLLGLGAALLLGAGPAPQIMYPADNVAYLDMCQRTAAGQWLGRDYTAPIGPAAILPVALAMRFGQVSVGAFATGAALTWLGFGWLAWRLARPRMSDWVAVAFALFSAGTAAAPYTLDFGSWRSLSYGMLYNRAAWAVLGLAAAAALLRRQDGREARFVPAGLGVAAVWLWALKPNYLLILAPLAVFSFVTAARRASWLARATAGALLGLTLVWVCVPFSPAGYVATHLGMARSAAAAPMLPNLLRTLQENLVPVFFVGAAWVLALRVAPAAGRLRLALAVGATLLATFVTNLANCQFSEIPLWGALGWIAAALATPAGRILGIACGLAFTWQPLASIPYEFAWKHYRAPGNPPALAVASPAWHDLPMRPVPGQAFGPSEALESAGNYAAWLNDGLQVLRRAQPDARTVLCLDWTNPFPFALGQAPVAGDEVAWHIGRTVSPAHHPDPDRLLQSAAVVMEPLRSLQPESLAYKRTLFGPGLARSFRLAAESAHWRAWVRTSP